MNKVTVFVRYITKTIIIFCHNAYRLTYLPILFKGWKQILDFYTGLMTNNTLSFPAYAHDVKSNYVP